VQEFIARFLPSVEHLRIFLILQRNAMRSWSAAEIAAEIRVAESTAADVLEQLASDNFLAIKISNDILYRFNPATDALRAISSTCAELYARNRVAMITLPTTATMSPIDE
jgi:hypothetical protein